MLTFTDSNPKRSIATQSNEDHTENTAPNATDDSRLQCTFSGCYKSYSSQKNLNHHIKRNHHGEKFKCKVCGKVLETKFSLQRHFQTTHKKECTENDIEKTTCPPLSATPVEDQDNLIKEQQKEIDNLRSAIKTTKDEIKELRTKLIAKRRLSTELKTGNERSMIVLRKAY